MPLIQVSSRGLRYDFRKKTLKKCAKASAINRFADQLWMFRISQPNSTWVTMNCTLSRLGSTRPVVEQQQDAGKDLHGEQEQGHAPEVVPDLLRVNRHTLLGDEAPHIAE